MRNLVIGRGQIGSAIIQILEEGKEAVASYDLTDGPARFDVEVDILHICIPYSGKFNKFVGDYIKFLKPKHTIVYSSVPIGTCKKLGVVHSPVEGRHPDLALSIRTMPRWVGYEDIHEAQFFYGFFTDLGLRVCTVPATDWTEFLKLRSTAKYGINLVWTDYEGRVAKELGMDFELLKEFDRNYNKLYHELGMDWAQRYILDPPKGIIGGHCVVPNAKLLNEQFPSDLLYRIIAKEKL